MVNRVVLEIPDTLLRRIEQITAVCDMGPTDVILLALDAACTPDGHKLQRMYALCDQADGRSAPHPRAELT